MCAAQGPLPRAACNSALLVRAQGARTPRARCFKQLWPWRCTPAPAHLDKANVGGVLPEALAADVQVVLAHDAALVAAHLAASPTMAVAGVETDTAAKATAGAQRWTLPTCATQLLLRLPGACAGCCPLLRPLLNAFPSPSVACCAQLPSRAIMRGQQQQPLARAGTKRSPRPPAAGPWGPDQTPYNPLVPTHTRKGRPLTTCGRPCHTPWGGCSTQPQNPSWLLGLLLVGQRGGDACLWTQQAGRQAGRV